MRRLLALATATLALSACEQTVHLYASPDGGHAGGGEGGRGMFDGGGADRSCSTSVTVMPDAPQMVVVLDRSTNMSGQSFGTQGQNQLDAAMGALEGQIGIFGSSASSRPPIALSFLAFPDTGGGCQGSSSCCAGDPKAWQDFNSNIRNCEMFPSSCVSSANRPMAAALANAHSILTGPGSASSYQRYVLLITDGPPAGCYGSMQDGDCRETSQAIQTLTGDKINVSILGLQPDLGCLDLLYSPYGPYGPIAQSVANPSDLAAAVNAIMQSAVCSAMLSSQAPFSSGDLTVTFQRTVVPPDDPYNGWTYDMFGRLHLHGQACLNVLSGWSDLKVTASCSSGGVHTGPGNP